MCTLSFHALKLLLSIADYLACAPNGINQICPCFYLKRLKSKLIQQIYLTEIWTARNHSMRQFNLNETDALKPVSFNTIRCFFNLIIKKPECNLDLKIEKSWGQQGIPR